MEGYQWILLKSEIVAWSVPTIVTEIQSFLGLLVGYYQRFIEGFSKIAKPMMTSLLEKGFDIYCDACGQGLGCVLMKKDM
jgi:hypothetical protein